MKKFTKINPQKKRFILLSILASILFTTVLLTRFGYLVNASFGSWGDSSLIHGCKNTRGLIALVGSSDTCNEDETQVTWLKDVNAGTGLTATRDSSGVTLSANTSGWFEAGETWTYASADSPSFTFTISGDKTGKYSPGMRVKLTQTTDKYFIVTKIEYSNPNTTVTVYGGTDYTLANASIANPYFSNVKAPFGFPLDPAKWTVQTIYSSSGSQGDPAINTWYNIGSVSIDVPIGAWRLDYATLFGFDAYSDGSYNALVTLSTSNNSESDTNLTSSFSAAPINVDVAWASKEKYINLTSKTTYYMNLETNTSGLGVLYLGYTGSPTVIQAVCSYL